MTDHRPAAELRAALDGLTEIRRIVEAGEALYRTNMDRQRALALCWISVGSALKHFAAATGRPQLHGPLTPAIRLRDKLAHQPVTRLDSAVLWQTSIHDAPRLRAVIEALSVEPT